MLVAFGLAIVVVLGVISAVRIRSFGQAHLAGDIALDVTAERQRDLRSYTYGLGLALALTGVPFGLVYWSALPRYWLPIAIGIFAVVQVVVHFRFFLHIDAQRQNMDKLHLILFTVLLLTMMGGGTVWLLANLAFRMG